MICSYFFNLKKTASVRKPHNLFHVTKSQYFPHVVLNLPSVLRFREIMIPQDAERCSWFCFTELG